MTGGSGRAVRWGHAFVATLMVGFALAVGLALNEFGAAVEAIGASLAGIATIGN